jgi:hypothetical protein
MRAGPLFFSFSALSLSVPAPALAETWNLHPAISLKAADVYLSARNPADQYGSSFKAAEGQLRILREDANSIWQTSATLLQAQANEAPYGESQLRSSFQKRDKFSLSNIDLSYRQTHGFDPLGQLIEEAANKDSRSFESVYAGLYHQTALDAANDIGVYLGGGKNSEGDFTVESKDAQLSWDHRHSVAWSSRIRLRLTDAETKQKEILQEHLYRFNPKLSSELTYGYAIQDNREETTGAALWGISMQYRTSGLLNSPTAYQALGSSRTMSAEEVESLRGASLYKLGWTHSRDQRRAGDPYYYADIFYGSAVMEFWGKQSIELKGSHSRASEHQLLDSQDDLQSGIIQANYLVPHRFMTRYPDALLTLGYSAERTELPPRRYFREIYQASYALVW